MFLFFSGTFVFAGKHFAAGKVSCHVRDISVAFITGDISLLKYICTLQGGTFIFVSVQNKKKWQKVSFSRGLLEESHRAVIQKASHFSSSDIYLPVVDNKFRCSKKDISGYATDLSSVDKTVSRITIIQSTIQ